MWVVLQEARKTALSMISTAREELCVPPHTSFFFFRFFQFLESFHGISSFRRPYAVKFAEVVVLTYTYEDDENVPRDFLF
jgi:hypothetical protein